MSDTESLSAEARSAGSMLRAARERQGLHIAALAAAIKVPPAKLDALEGGRYGELTDATFVRALALSVCKVLKIDAKPVLELLPSAPGAMLEKVDKGLKAPFRERPGRAEPSESRLWHEPVFWVVAILLAAAAAFLFWPKRPPWLSMTNAPAAAPAVAAAPAAAPAIRPDATSQTETRVAPEPVNRSELPRVAPLATAASDPALGAAAVVVETVHSVPDVVKSSAAAPAPSGLVVLRASEPSWVEVQNGLGAVLMSRTLQPGEAVGVDGSLPLRLTIGNAAATEVTLRGKPVPLGPPTRDNVVRLELK